MDSEELINVNGNETFSFHLNCNILGYVYFREGRCRGCRQKVPVMLSACLFYKRMYDLLVTWDRNKLMFSRVDIMLTVGLRFVKSFNRFQ